MKNNYVILSTDWDVYRQLYSDVIGRDNVCYVAGPQATKRGLKKILYRLHFNKQLNRLVNLPFKGIWNRSYFNCPFDNNNPICFILFRDWVSLDAYTGYINWLKRKYPGSKFVWFLHDMLAQHNDFYTGNILDINHYKQVFDLVFTCNQAEALRYGLSYHRVSISKLYKGSGNTQCDVLFFGKDKGRLERLIHIYDVLTRKGARCRFFVSESSIKSICPSRDGFVLLDNPMPYNEVQKWISGSNCLLELRSAPEAGETLRASEALMYGKKLITDLIDLADSKDFDSNSIRILASDDDIEKIDVPFMTSTLNKSEEKMEAYCTRLSPITFLEELDSML